MTVYIVADVEVTDDTVTPLTFVKTKYGPPMIYG